MNKKTLLITATILLITVGFFFITKSNSSRVISNTSVLPSENTKNMSVASPAKVPADKIEVVHFHATQQCWSCITMGEYALKTIKEKFPDEYASGKIVFKNINGELKENRDIVTKYQARGSSLFVNAITGDTEDIKEDTRVWRLVGNEQQYIDYFETKLKGLLGK